MVDNLFVMYTCFFSMRNRLKVVEKPLVPLRPTGRPSTINEMKVYNTLRGTWFFRKTIYVSLFAILTV